MEVFIILPVPGAGEAGRDFDPGRQTFIEIGEGCGGFAEFDDQRRNGGHPFFVVGGEFGRSDRELDILGPRADLPPSESTRDCEQSDYGHDDALGVGQEVARALANLLAGPWHPFRRFPLEASEDFRQEIR